jgi:hypothetical protein
VIIAMNLQTSFLHPPFGFALFYLRSVAAKSEYNDRITKKNGSGGDHEPDLQGAIAFIVMQVIMVGRGDRLSEPGAGQPGQAAGGQNRSSSKPRPSTSMPPLPRARTATAKGTRKKAEGKKKKRKPTIPAKALQQSLGKGK